MLFNDIPGWLTKQEGKWLTDVATRHQLILEIGCWKGRSTCALCEGCPGVVFTVDSFVGTAREDQKHHFGFELPAEVLRQCKQNLHNFIRKQKLFIIEAPNHVAYPILRQVFKYQKPSMIFIDAEHDEQHFRYDLTNCLELLRPDGLICGHDYNKGEHPAVTNVIQERFPGLKHRNDVGTIWYVPAS